MEYSAVSLDAIAAGAGVTRGLLHHSFGTKRGLHLAVVRWSVTGPPGVAIVPPDGTGDFHQVIHACVEAWMKMLRFAGGLWPGSSPQILTETDVDLVLAT